MKIFHNGDFVSSIDEIRWMMEQDQKRNREIRRDENLEFQDTDKSETTDYFIAHDLYQEERD